MLVSTIKINADRDLQIRLYGSSWFRPSRPLRGQKNPPTVLSHLVWEIQRKKKAQNQNRNRFFYWLFIGVSVTDTNNQ